VGIYIGDNTFAHSATGQGVVKTRLDDPYYWGKRYVGAKRVPLPAVEAARKAAEEQVAQRPAEQAPQQAAGQEQQAAEQAKETAASAQPDVLPQG